MRKKLVLQTMIVPSCQGNGLQETNLINPTVANVELKIKFNAFQENSTPQIRHHKFESCTRAT